MRVAIRGDGVAAYCCAYLLKNAGFEVSLVSVQRPRLPAILLGDQALALIRDIFDQPALFADLPRIGKRVVAWGSSPATVEHSAVVVSEDDILNAIRPTLGGSGDAPWTIFASRPLPSPVAEHRFGSRTASAVPVVRKEGSDTTACWIESVESGWLFLIPGPDGTGWLLAVGDEPARLLPMSQVVAAEVAGHGPVSNLFPSYSRISAPLCAPGWLACGTAAMAFDPICGDGTAHAIREAILAAAVIRAHTNGGALDSLLGHYQARLTAGFQRHLLLSRQFYSSGGTGPFWKAELAATEKGIAWCTAQLGPRPAFRYQLRGLELEAVV